MALNIEIFSTLNITKLFNKAFNFPVSSYILLNEDSKLFCIEFITEKKSLDLGKILNEIFNITCSENKYLIKTATIFYISQSKDILSTKFFSQKEFLKKVKNILSKISSQEIYFYFSMEISKFYLWNDIVKIGENNDRLDLVGQFSISNINEGKNSEKEFIAKLPDITILEIFSLNEAFLYVNFGKENKFYFKGILEIRLFEKEFAFCGEIDINEKGYVGILKTKSSDTLDLFGTGIFLKNFCFCLEYDKEKNNYIYAVKGNITLGSFSLEGKIEFLEKIPKIVFMKLNENIQISFLIEALSKKYNVPKWPNDIFDLEIFKDSYFSYCQKDIEDTPYKAGMQLYIHTKLKLHFEVEIKGFINIFKNVISAGIVLENKIDLIFLELFDMDETNNLIGPTFSLMIGNETKMSFKGRVNFFGIDMGECTFICGQKTNQKDISISGVVDVPKILVNFFGKKFNFSYNKQNGFKVDSFNSFEFEDESLSFIKFWKDVMKKTQKQCGDFSDAIKDNCIKIRFKISPEVKKGKELDENFKETSLYFVMKLKYEVYFEKEVLFGKDFKKNVYFEIKKDIKAENFSKNLVKALSSIMESIIEAIFEDENALEELTKILGILIAEKMLKKYIGSLVCRKLINKELQSALEKSLKVPSEGGGGGGSSSGGASGGGGYVPPPFIPVPPVPPIPPPIIPPSGGGSGGKEPEKKEPEKKEIKEIISEAKNNEETIEKCYETLIKNYPELTIKEIAKFFQEGSYSLSEINLLFCYLGLSLEERVSLLEYLSEPVLSLEEIIIENKKSGKSAIESYQMIVKIHPYLDKKSMYKLLQNGGYNLSEINLLFRYLGLSLEERAFFLEYLSEPVLSLKEIIVENKKSGKSAIESYQMIVKIHPYLNKKSIYKLLQNGCYDLEEIENLILEVENE